MTIFDPGKLWADKQNLKLMESVVQGIYLWQTKARLLTARKWQ
jgi:hypothetical protein